MVIIGIARSKHLHFICVNVLPQSGCHTIPTYQARTPDPFPHRGRFNADRNTVTPGMDWCR